MQDTHRHCFGIYDIDLCIHEQYLFSGNETSCAAVWGFNRSWHPRGFSIRFGICDGSDPVGPTVGIEGQEASVGDCHVWLLHFLHRHSSGEGSPNGLDMSFFWRRLRFLSPGGCRSGIFRHI